MDSTGPLHVKGPEQFCEARLVRITDGGFALWLDPFGVLDSQIVVNLLPELAISVDLVMRGTPPVERFKDGARRQI